MSRKLVTIRAVTAINKIEGADLIEAVSIDGWVCVSQIGTFKVGQLAVFHEIDSFLDISIPRYAFLSKEHIRTYNGVEGLKLKTKRLKKVWSQGLLLPLSDFPELKGKSYSAGDDITELAGVVLWEPPVNVSTRADKDTRQYAFPSFIPKTDEERIQNIPQVLNDKETVYEVTEKLDGTSFTAFYGGPVPEFGVCSRSLWLKPYTPNIWQRLSKFASNYWRMIRRRGDFRFWKLINQYDATGTDNVYWLMAKRHNLDAALPGLLCDYALQGEIVGEGIQKNHYKLHGQQLFIFNVYNIGAGRYLEPQERLDLIDHINKTMELAVPLVHVPVVDHLTMDEFTDMRSLLEYADGPSTLNPQVSREGVVFKSLTDTQHSFKVISNKFLLKNEE